MANLADIAPTSAQIAGMAPPGLALPELSSVLKASREAMLDLAAAAAVSQASTRIASAAVSLDSCFSVESARLVSCAKSVSMAAVLLARLSAAVSSLLALASKLAVLSATVYDKL